MPNLKDLKVRINSVKSTQKITSAMKMVAAAKLKRAQEAAEAARPYAVRMDRMIAALGANVSGGDGPKLLTGTGRDDVHLIVVATADRGLCGGFNSTIVRAARRKIDKLLAEGKTVKVMTVGRKGRDQLRRVHGDKIISSKENLARTVVGFTVADEIGRELIRRFEDGEFDVATMFFNRFKSAMTQVVTEQQLIPANLPEGEQEDTGELKALYEFEPDEESILAALLPRNVATQIFTGLLENAASEHGARMTAMDSATRNAGDMINKLTLTYNRTRQAYITKELIEIISGAEAL
ncbi:MULTISPECIES: F0F1 ATP synthase subunit gamma [Thalassobaculum]|uniref:ATP synthase gamma chain n=1 Tax=Thalassobaculum litoreum DSM 18839 TaxID=1123362 RepID=A0A8G2EXL2_9PROT|nr:MULTISPECIES: F0F1 ATP synthase subunit gamma [Thalassobaculum]SDG23488.1 F-type H+-transporting ATPase subunit gamma [Thalassobaculum litoreum DSM 18839]